MSSSGTVVPLRQPDTVDDPLTAVLRDGARCHRRLHSPQIWSAPLTVDSFKLLF